MPDDDPAAERGPRMNDGNQPRSRVNHFPGQLPAEARVAYSNHESMLGGERPVREPIIAPDYATACQRKIGHLARHEEPFNLNSSGMAGVEHDPSMTAPAEYYNRILHILLKKIPSGPWL